jgi:EAL domain-containing protein (putative c-di-GMP-specific phosphodiesterase class I)/DNA-binding response OmpR family regulator
MTVCRVSPPSRAAVLSEPGGSTVEMSFTDMSGSRVYVADDVPANRALLETILRRAGLTDIQLFADGGDLLDAIEASEPDLILLDLRMPVVDGLEVLRRLDIRRSERAYLPILVLTAESNPEPRRAALDLGANDYVTKPFDAGEVLLRVRNLLHTRALHRALRERNVDLSEQVDVARGDLADREREWADVARALADLEVRESSEETANAICNELKRISGLSAVMIVAIDAGGRAVPLAFDGAHDVRIGINRALPEPLVEQWRGRLGRRPWVGPWAPAFGAVLRRLPGETPSGMAIVPMSSSQGALGALVALTSIRDGIDYLTARLPVLTSFGAVASALLAPGILERQRHGATRAEVEAVLIDRTFHPVFQPVVELASGTVIGYEALTRFDDGMRPDRRFADAAAVDLGVELEAVTITAALGAAESLPADRWLSLNVSPEFLLDPVRPREVLSRRGQRSIVLEITEHVAIEDYSKVRAAVSALGSAVGFAVDDAGAGYASFRHILELHPDFVKLDIGLVREIDLDDVRQALVAGIVYFAERTGCRLIAEGIETIGERDRLQRLGVECGQGFLLARPAPADLLMDAAAATGPVARPDRERVRQRVRQR